MELDQVEYHYSHSVYRKSRGEITWEHMYHVHVLHVVMFLQTSKDYIKYMLIEHFATSQKNFVEHTILAEKFLLQYHQVVDHK